jgi:hypothetical protein
LRFSLEQKTSREKIVPRFYKKKFHNVKKYQINTQKIKKGKQKISSRKFLGFKKIGNMLRFQIVAKNKMRKIAKPKMARFEIAEKTRKLVMENFSALRKLELCCVFKS